MTEAAARNPAGKKSGQKTALRALFPILGLTGMGISGYLTAVHFQNTESICLFNANCDAVLTSPYSQMWGVPLSLLGLLLYAGLAFLGFWRLLFRDRMAETVDLGIYGLALSGTLFTLYLYYLEIFEIHAFCSWCITSSIVIFITFILSIINLSSGKTPAGRKSRPRGFRLSKYIGW